MRKTLIALLFLAFCPFLVAQQTLNNDAIIKLVKAGLSDDLIASTIASQAGAYDTSTDGLIALKAAGVSDKLVAAIVSKAAAPAPLVSPATPPAPAQAPAADDPNDPAAPHDPGVYLMTTSFNGKRTMEFVDRASIASAKTSNVMGAAFSYGIAKAKVKVDLTGSHARLRTTSARPVFYMYFPPAINLGGLGGTDIITSPSQFTLLLLDDKKDHRESTVAKIGLGSAKYGNDEKRTNQFNSERVRSGVYKVMPVESLKYGEYAFIATTKVSGTQNGETYVIYDFGVDGQ
ncbi:MAG: hypothetical protein ABR976_19040 [Terracidiphilus sp.]|jgi:hypothetical protein